MGCGDACPFYPGKRYIDWDLPDPAGLDLAAVRPIRDDIHQRVRHLVSELSEAMADWPDWLTDLPGLAAHGSQSRRGGCC
jgi:hypothetical protein